MGSIESIEFHSEKLKCFIYQWTFFEFNLLLRFWEFLSEKIGRFLSTIDSAITFISNLIA